jgi:hypothetical protein
MQTYYIVVFVFITVLMLLLYTCVFYTQYNERKAFRQLLDNGLMFPFQATVISVQAADIGENYVVTTTSSTVVKNELLSLDNVMMLYQQARGEIELD